MNVKIVSVLTLPEGHFSHKNSAIVKFPRGITQQWAILPPHNEARHSEAITRPGVQEARRPTGRCILKVIA
ncbi:hypothetical protein E2C01_038693 [Portunus trituberculatus]|uniref:Uncharacterized protein n=1 Tax=Portunus trituberculatus TaxID=210409 RepID=A0A5B7FBH1_PORTR|nr:hypothetical protein [Portunus trituberculatus]